MRNYLVEIWLDGEDNYTHFYVKAKDENDLYKKVYIIIFQGYANIEEYEENNDQPYSNLDAKECLSEMESSRDNTLLYILETDSLEVIYNINQTEEKDWLKEQAIIE